MGSQYTVCVTSVICMKAKLYIYNQVSYVAGYLGADRTTTLHFDNTLIVDWSTQEDLLEAEEPQKNHRPPGPGGHIP